MRVEIIKPQLTGVYHPHKGKLKDGKKKNLDVLRNPFVGVPFFDFFQLLSQPGFEHLHQVLKD